MLKIQCRGTRLLAFAALTAVLLFIVWVDARAEDVNLTKEAFITPPKVLADAVLNAQPDDKVNLTNISPDGKKFLITKTDGMPTLERMGRPCVHLGELAFDPVAHRSHGLYVRSNSGYEIFHLADRRKVTVEIPADVRVSNPAWSPDGSLLAFFGHFADKTHIFVANTTTGKSRQVTQIPVLATLVTAFQWSKEGKRIQTVLLPNDGKDEFKASPVATEPKVRVAMEGKNPSRTYRYLLDSPSEMKLLEHLCNGQLAFIDVENGYVTKVGQPSMMRSISMSPSNHQFRVTTMTKPFSYYVPADKFGSHEEIWDHEGKNLHVLAEKKLRETEPQPGLTPAKGKGGKKGQAVQQQPDAGNPQKDGLTVDADGKRDLVWRPDGVGMSFLQVEPKGKDDKGPRKDRVLQWQPPYGKDDIKVIYETPHRIAAVQYADDCQMLFLTLTVENQRQVVAVDLADPKQATYILQKSTAPGAVEGQDEADFESPYTPPAEDLPELGFGDEYEQQKKGGGKGYGGAGGPGAANLMVRANRGEGKTVRISSTGEIYFAGTDKSGGALFPRVYIDKIDIKTGNKTRIFAGRGDLLETIDSVDGDDIKLVFTTRQNKDVVPNSYINDLQMSKSDQLTSNEDRSSWFHKLSVEKIQVTRVDGFKFWAKVTRAPSATGKQPGMFWIYPKEYTDQASYNAKGAGGPDAGGKGPDQPGRFTAPAPRSMAMLTLLGYTVVEPDVPIVGPAGRMNDNYVADLRNSLWAVIDELDKRGLIDRDRLACGGHSYGGFSTANALAHTPFFKAGIAGDGNYNRTLTPMSFQTEKRFLWDAHETYLEMSPLLWANRINGALLMYHSMDDANVGTNPINADFLYMSLRGLGKPTALYMYPYEGHGPLAKETTLDQWARWVGWLDTYVMHPKKGVR